MSTTMPPRLSARDAARLARTFPFPVAVYCAICDRTLKMPDGRPLTTRLVAERESICDDCGGPARTIL